MNFTRLACVAVVSILGVSGVARADWEANYSAVSSKGEFKPIAGKIFFRPDRVRVDSPYPMELSIFAKNGSNKVFAAVHSFHIRLTSTVKEMSGKLPACFAKSFDECVSALKFKKVATEPCEAKTCEVFEGKPKLSGVQAIKVWHWKGEKEAILAKSIITKSNGGILTVTFTGIEKKSYPDAFFSVPAGYKDAGSIDRFFGDLSGKSPSE